MVRLKSQCISAFIGHSINLDCNPRREAYVFARKLLVSKSYLQCSRLDSAYQMKISAAYSGGISLSFGNGNSESTLSTRSLPDARVQKLLKFFNPSIIFVEDLYNSWLVISGTNGKLALDLFDQDSEVVSEFITNHSSRVKILECYSQYSMNEQIPTLTLDYLRLYDLYNTGDFKPIMRHQTKELKIENIQQDRFLQEALTIDDSEPLPMSRSVKALRVTLRFDSEQKTIRLVEGLKKFFPCVETLELHVRQHKGAIGKFRSEQLASAVLAEYTMIKRIKHIYQGDFHQFSINFECYFRFSKKAGLDEAWITELMKHGQFKHAKAAFYGTEGPYLWHSITSCENEKSCSLNFRVVAGM